jgi:hypothetical protein
MTDDTDRIGEPLTLEVLATGADLDRDHPATGSPCRVCGFLTWGSDGALGHAPAVGEVSKARIFVALRAPGAGVRAVGETTGDLEEGSGETTDGNHYSTAPPAVRPTVRRRTALMARLNN